MTVIINGTLNGPIQVEGVLRGSIIVGSDSGNLNVGARGPQGPNDIVQQGPRAGQVIYVQLTGDPNPPAPVAGEVRFEA